MRKRVFMKKIYLKIVLIFVAITLLTSGCVRNDVTVTFDNHDNMIVRTKLLYKEDISDYISLDDLAPEKLKDSFAVKADKIQVNTTFEDMDIENSLGHYQVETCKHVSHAKNIKKISILEPQSDNNSILNVQNFIFFKKYIFQGKVVPAKELVEKVRNSKELFSSKNPESYINSNVVIEIPKQAKSIKTNACMDDMGQGSKYYWIITNDENLINIEFYLINWGGIITSILLLCFIVYYALCKRLIFNWRQLISKIARSLDSLSTLTETTNVNAAEMSNDVSINQANSIPKVSIDGQIIRKNLKTKTIVIIIVTLVVILFAGVFYFSIPKICKTLIDNSIQNIYSGNAEKAIQFIGIAKKLSPNEDFSKDIYTKGIEEFNKNNMSNADTFMKMTLKLDSKQAEYFSKELTNKSISALDSKQYAKAKKLMEYALKFDAEIPNKKRGDILQKCINLGLAQKFDEALAYADMLIQINPKDVEGYSKKGMALTSLNRTKEAIDTYTTIINMKNNSTMSYLSRGNIYLYPLKDYDKALYDYNKVIALSQNQTELGFARFGLAKIYGEQRQYRKAMNEAWIAKDIFYSIGNIAMSNESQKLFDLVAEYECMYNDYCY